MINSNSKIAVVIISAYTLSGCVSIGGGQSKAESDLLTNLSSGTGQSKFECTEASRPVFDTVVNQYGGFYRIENASVNWKSDDGATYASVVCVDDARSISVGGVKSNESGPSERYLSEIKDKIVGLYK